MYTAQAYDVVNGLVRLFGYSNTQAETHIAREMIQEFEPNSITLYDRLHCGYNLVFAHTEANNYFIVRARTSGPNAQKDITVFRDSAKRSEIILLHKYNHRLTTPPLAVRLVKIKNPRSRENLIFMTNLSKDQFSDRQVAKLYQRRWDIEGSFRDLTTTLKMEQWHAKTLNGILQEIYAVLWLVNAAKMECLIVQKMKAAEWLNDRYQKTNFKHCVSLMIEHLQLLLSGKTNSFRKILSHYLGRCLERRKHLSRHYPRVLKGRGRAFDCDNLVPRRA